jgi:hypothetical protein
MGRAHLIPNMDKIIGAAIWLIQNANWLFFVAIGFTISFLWMTVTGSLNAAGVLSWSWLPVFLPYSIFSVAYIAAILILTSDNG